MKAVSAEIETLACRLKLETLAQRGLARASRLAGSI
jgi:hypothetical protein